MIQSFTRSLDFRFFMLRVLSTVYSFMCWLDAMFASGSNSSRFHILLSASPTRRGKNCFRPLSVSFVYAEWLRPCPYLTGSLCLSGGIFRLVLAQQSPFFKLRVRSISPKTQGRDGGMSNIPKEIKSNVTRVNEILILGIKQKICSLPRDTIIVIKIYCKWLSFAYIL